LAAGQGQIEEQIETWQKLSEQLHVPLNSVDEQLQTELILLAVSLAKSVLNVELETNTNVIFQALSEGLKVLPISEKSYQIHLNPEDILLIRNHFSEEEIEKHRWHLVDSPDMQKGGCDIITDTNAVDISVEKRTRDVIERFLIEQGLEHEQSR
jgi:flagellar assembly protein FliH